MQSDPEIDGDEIFDEAKWNALYRKRQQQRVVAAVKFFRENGIEPIVFKGWAVGNYYPMSVSRAASDTDIAVRSSDHKRAAELARLPEGRKLVVDIHSEFRDLDTLPWHSIFAKCELLDADGEQIRVPCLEDHIRIVCVHWLLDGGSNKQKLWDIYYLVNARTKTFDWDRCLDAAGPTRRRWVECALGLAQKYLALDLTGTPLEGAAERLPAWLTTTVEREWASGRRLEPLHAHLHSPAGLIRQIGYRLPPNPLHAVIALNGNIDSTDLYLYQARNFLGRIIPALGRSLKRIGK